MAVPTQGVSITIVECDAKLAELVRLAPEFSYRDLDTVKHRYTRSSVTREEFSRALRTTMLLKLQEYDREALAHDIDGKWLALRKIRQQLVIVSRRKRQHGEVDAARPLPRRFPTVTDCAICTLSLNDGAISNLECGHQLHSPCLTRHVTTQGPLNSIIHTLCPTGNNG